MKTNVVVTVFNVESEGFQALTELRQKPVTEEYAVSAGALLKKKGENCDVLDGFDTGIDSANDTAIGGLLGMTIGILGGPIGMLLGGTYGALAGANLDTAESVFGMSMLEQIADKLDDGMVAIVALADEKKEAALDERFADYDVVIARFDADKVAEEVDRAYEMQHEMARRARMELRKEKEEAARKELEENAEILREGFRK